MVKRTTIEVKKKVLEVLSDNEKHSYGDIERKANTNWQSVRNHCDELVLFDAALITEDNKVKITDYGQKVLKKFK